MDARLLRRHVRLPDDVERPLLDSYRRGDLSARGRDRTLRLARTIADLAASDEVRREHVVAALGLPPGAERRRGGGGVSAGANAGAARACGPCLARTWLIARLAGAIEIARHQRRRLREILALSEEKLVAGLGGARAGAIADEFERLDIDALREAVARSGLEAACRHDPAYPARLRDLDDAPATLFIAGGVSRLEGLVGADLAQGPRAVAVVGTRRASADGLEVARALGRGLAAAGVTVVSGMALGVDSAAHAGALESSGRTVAVLAGGADVPYPPSKARLHAADRRARLRGRRVAAGVRRDALVLSGAQSHHRRAGGT